MKTIDVVLRDRITKSSVVLKDRITELPVVLRDRVTELHAVIETLVSKPIFSFEDKMLLKTAAVELQRIRTIAMNQSAIRLIAELDQLDSIISLLCKTHIELYVEADPNLTAYIKGSSNLFLRSEANKIFYEKLFSGCTDMTIGAALQKIGEISIVEPDLIQTEIFVDSKNISEQAHIEVTSELLLGGYYAVSEQISVQMNSTNLEMSAHPTMLYYNVFTELDNSVMNVNMSVLDAIYSVSVREIASEIEIGADTPEISQSKFMSAKENISLLCSAELSLEVDVGSKNNIITLDGSVTSHCGRWRLLSDMDDLALNSFDDMTLDDVSLIEY